MRMSNQKNMAYRLRVPNDIINDHLDGNVVDGSNN